MRNLKDYRMAGKIVYVKSGKEDHGLLTSYVGVEFDIGTQGFGGLCLDERTLAMWERGLCETFGVDTFEALVGLPCQVLKAFPHFNETIEGIEATNGRRFTLTKFVSVAYPGKGERNPLEQAIERCHSDISYFARRADEANVKLQALASEFVDWDTYPQL